MSIDKGLQPTEQTPQYESLLNQKLHEWFPWIDDRRIVVLMIVVCVIVSITTLAVIGVLSGEFSAGPQFDRQQLDTDETDMSSGERLISHSTSQQQDTPQELFSELANDVYTSPSIYAIESPL